MQIGQVHFPEAELETLCRARGVLSLAIFGSVLRDDFGPASDIDMLVTFLPGRGPGLLAFAGLQQELTVLLGREVHLHTEAMLPPRARGAVKAQARVLHAA